MKREIKFRGKRLDGQGWAFGSYIEAELQNGIAHEIIPYKRGEPVVEVDPDTVGQFTGVKDKNGMRIFEGDVIECLDSFDGPIRYRVEFRPEKGYFALFLIKGGDPWAIKVGNPDVGYICQSHIDKWSKYIIGNIHDNPDLLETE